MKYVMSILRDELRAVRKAKTTAKVHSEGTGFINKITKEWDDKEGELLEAMQILAEVELKKQIER